MKKRIALAAVAALAGGLLVAAPASAVAHTETDTLTSGYVFWDGATVAGPSNFVNITIDETATSAMYGARVEISGSTILGVTDASNDIAATQVSSTVAIIGEGDTIKVGVTANGTITANVYWATGIGTFSATAQVATYVVAAPAAAEAFNHASVVLDDYSDYVIGGAVFSDKGSNTIAPTNWAADFRVKQFSQAADETLSSTSVTKAVTVSLSGVGVLSCDPCSGYSTYLAFSAGDSADQWVYVYGDGRSGVATITFAVNGVVIATKTVTFFGAPAKYTATVNHAQIAVGGDMTLTVKTVDANGIAVPGITFNTIAAGDSTTVTHQAGTIAGTETYTVHGVNKVAHSLVVGNGAAETATVVANFVAAGIASVAIAADKATYAPGEKMTFTVTAKNADGVAVGDGTYQIKNLSTSTAVYGVANDADVAVLNGVGTFTAYAPVIGGPVVLSAGLNTSTTGTVTVSVVDPAATAQAAAITALQTSVATLTTTVASLVASMTAQIKVINATMLKIQKALAALSKKIK